MFVSPHYIKNKLFFSTSFFVLLLFSSRQKKTTAFNVFKQTPHLKVNRISSIFYFTKPRMPKTLATNKTRDVTEISKNSKKDPEGNRASEKKAFGFPDKFSICGTLCCWLRAVQTQTRTAVPSSEMRKT